MMMRRTHFAPLSLALLLAAAPAHAQTLSEIGRSVTDGAQIEAAIARGATPRGDGEDDQAIDGEAGIYVLRKADIFFVGGEAGVSYSTNPLRTVDDVGGSGAAEASLDIGVQTLIFEKVNFSAVASFAGTRYFKDFAPSNTVASGNMSLSTGIGKTPFLIGASAFGGWNFDRDVKAATGFYGASVHVGAVLPLDRQTILHPLLVASRVKNEVGENDSKSIGLRTTLARRMGRMTVSANAVVSRFWFDDFYEDVTFVPRRDWQYEGGIAVSYALTPRATLAASARYVKRDSSFFLSNYAAVDSGVGLALNWRF
jgi:hypothetical protein